MHRKMVYRGGCGSALDAECAAPFCEDEWIEVGRRTYTLLAFYCS